MISLLQSVLVNPEPRHLEEIVFDSTRKKIILFGGVQIRKDGKILTPENVFERDAHSWKELSSSGPGNRLAPGLVYDTNHKLTFLIGGVGLSDGKETVMLDVWCWDGKKWASKNIGCPVKSGRPVYDEDQKRILVYGDAYNINENWKAGDPRNFELWELKENRWKKLSTDGPKLNSPYKLVFDRNRKSLIILSWEDGKFFVWEWTTKWIKTECTGEVPTARNRYALAYHKKEKATYLFGGFDDSRKFLNDFWKWDGNDWTKITSKNILKGRAGCGLEYGMDGLFLYGGTTEDGLTNELWQFKNYEWKLLSP